MKTFTNKRLTLNTDAPEGSPLPPGTPGSYADLAVLAVKNPPQGGLGPDDMRKRIRILDLVENTEIDQDIEIEDADAETLKTCVSEMRWAILDRGIMEFCDAVEAL